MDVSSLTWFVGDDGDIGGRGIAPALATPGSMAFDFFAPRNLFLPGAMVKDGSRDGCVEVGSLVVNTLISVRLPQNCAMILGSRSGLAAKDLITVEAGWIDNDYRGPIGVVLYNHGWQGRHFGAGDRIAQGMLVPVLTPGLVSVEYGQVDISETERGAGGFGHTGS